MKITFSTLIIVVLFYVDTGCVVGQETGPGHSVAAENTLSENDKRVIRMTIERILEKDQQFRSYLSFNTIDEQEISRIKKLDAKGQLSAMANNRGKLSEELQSVFNQLQTKNDKENWDNFVEIVERYGYPSPSRIDVEHDEIYVVLLHPPVDINDIQEHINKCKNLLMPEVTSGRMEPRKYATFIDNMQGKILGLPQLYGTNRMFDSKTKTVLPPLIEDLAQANKLRREIGMPELKSGEYRIAAKD